MSERLISNKKVLVTGGAGFIGSNLVEKLLKQQNNVVCLDNFLTGKKENIEGFLSNPSFLLVEGDIRDLTICREAVQGVDLVLHQAALGSVPRSINDPLTTNDININGFLNMLTATRDAKVKRFVYAASSSTYGDNYSLPKVEENIGKPLSPYAITKYVNELYADVFSKLYKMEVIGLRYFNVFGRHQDPQGMYAAVIPKFVQLLINHESPVINGDGSFSRDFTHIDNVIQANELAATVTSKAALGKVYNVAFGKNTSLLELVNILKNELGRFDAEIRNIDPVFGPERNGDIPHSLASIEKARTLLGYMPEFDIKKGLERAINWYWEHLK